MHCTLGAAAVLLLQLVGRGLCQQQQPAADTISNAVPTLPINTTFYGMATIFGSVPASFTGSTWNATGPPYSVGSNSCGFGPLPLGAWPYQYIAAISPNNSLVTLPQSGCGTCLPVRCVDTRADACRNLTAVQTGGSISRSAGVVVQVVDSCLSCGPTDLNLHIGAFAVLANPRLGRVHMSFKQVACRPDTNITVHLSELHSKAGGYVKLALRSVAGYNDLISVELATAGLQDLSPYQLRGGSTIWRSMDNLNGASWEFSGLPSSAPAYDMRLTDSNGQEVNIRKAIPARAAPGDYPTQNQFLLGP